MATKVTSFDFFSWNLCEYLLVKFSDYMHTETCPVWNSLSWFISAYGNGAKVTGLSLI